MPPLPAYPLKMEAKISLEKVAPLYQTTQWHILKCSNLYIHRRQYFKFKFKCLARLQVGAVEIDDGDSPSVFKILTEYTSDYQDDKQILLIIKL